MVDGNALKRPSHGGFPETPKDPPAREQGCPCEVCGHPVEVGHVVLLYDDVGEIHADCEHPFSLAPDLDDESPKPCVLLGEPMQLYPLPVPRDPDVTGFVILAPYGSHPDGTAKDLKDLD